MDITPSDYHLFRTIVHELAEQRFYSYGDTKKWADSRIALKTESFFLHGIHMLPERRQEVVSSDGQYFVQNVLFTLNFKKVFILSKVAKNYSSS